MVEVPSDREGFKAIVRLTGAATEAKEVLRRWTSEEMTTDARENSEPQRVLATEDDENECPPPPLHCLGEWLEATDLSSRRHAWGSAMGNPGNMVDASLAAPLEGYFEGCGARHEAMPSTAPSASNDGFWDDMPEPLSLEKGARPTVAYDS